MRKAYRLFALMTALICLLSSCSRALTAEETAYEIQEFYLSSGSISANADITADYGDRVFLFSLSYSDVGGIGTVTVHRPENISGISARVSPDGITLIYDDAEIYTGSITANGLSPVQALPCAVNAWRTGLITQCCFENRDGTDTVSVTFRISDGVSLKTWFECDTYLPCAAEMINDGVTVVNMTFYDVLAG